MKSTPMVPNDDPMLFPENKVFFLVDLKPYVNLTVQEKYDFSEVIQLPKHYSICFLFSRLQNREDGSHKLPVALVAPIIIITLQAAVLFFKLEVVLKSK